MVDKHCTKCLKLLPTTSFYPDKRATDGLRSCCRECTSKEASFRYLRTHPTTPRGCKRCGKIIEGRRSDSLYCTQSCRAALEKARYINTHPEYKARQRKLVTEIRHMKEHGHLRFINDPLLNPKDKYRVARSLGYRSMLEVNVARQLEDAGIDPRACYESVIIHYTRPTEPYKEHEEE